MNWQLAIRGKGAFLEARVCREKKESQDEEDAQTLNRIMPFIEYDIHKQLVYKLRLLGMNAVFGLKFNLAISDRLLIAVASCTAVYVAALPPPPTLSISRTLRADENEELFIVTQKIHHLSKNNV